MKPYILYILFGILVFAATANAQNYTITEFSRYAPFNELLTCENNLTRYNVTSLINLTQYNTTTNITIGNVTYQVIVINETPRIGVAYNIEFASDTATNGTVTNVMFIHDSEGKTVQQRDWSFALSEVKQVRFQLPFICPAEIANIDFRTCSQFFDTWISKDEPLLFSLASGTRQCQQELANRTAEYTSCQNEVRQIDNDRTTLRAGITQKEEANKACLDDLSKPYGSCYLRVLDERNATSSCLAKNAELVPAYWLWIAVLFIIITGISFLKQFVW